ncbi:MAG: 2-iminobutanoate/2-iminopropanoate deaminase [Legionellaceae bacterium]
MKKEIISTANAPSAIGNYSQAIKVLNTVYLSGQIPLNPLSGKLIEDGMEAQIHQVFQNLKAVAEAAGGTINHIVKLNIYLTDLTHFSLVNEIMAHYFSEPYPARAIIGVSALPKNAMIEMDGILVL